TSRALQRPLLEFVALSLFFSCIFERLPGHFERGTKPTLRNTNPAVTITFASGAAPTHKVASANSAAARVFGPRVPPKRWGVSRRTVAEKSKTPIVLAM